MAGRSGGSLILRSILTYRSAVLSVTLGGLIVWALCAALVDHVI